MCQSYLLEQVPKDGHLAQLAVETFCWVTLAYVGLSTPRERMWGSTWGRMDKEEAGTGWVVGQVIARSSWCSVPPQRSGRRGRKHFQVLRLTCAELGSWSTDSPGSCVEACWGGGMNCQVWHYPYALCGPRGLWWPESLQILAGGRLGYGPEGLRSSGDTGWALILAEPFPRSVLCATPCLQLPPTQKTFLVTRFDAFCRYPC